MKLDTEDKKLAYFMGYLQGLAESHAYEFDRNVEDVKQELLESLTKKHNPYSNVFYQGGEI